MREMGSLMFVTGRFDVAERFYGRAVARDPSDRLAQGYLGCTLLRLGRQADAREPLIRAGPGPWSACR
jgi:Flp pilus assembly protein TadD